MKCKAILTTAAAGAVLSVFSAVPVPEVSVFGMSQDSTGVATINYTLSAADAVVTLDIQTNATGGVWASIGGAAVSSADGDVWKKVEQGSRTITWDGATNWADGKIPSSGIRAVVTAWSLDNTPDYMVVDLSESAQPNTQKYYPSVDFLPGSELGQTGAITNNTAYRKSKLVMRKIMAKDVEWTMGSTALETNRTAAREATHQVMLESNYYIGVFPVTQTQWGLIQTSRAAPSYFDNADDRAMRPVEQVCYNEIRNAGNSQTANTDYDWPADPNPSSFLGLLRTKTGIDFDLPSEAQWEFAARAGNGDTKWSDGSGILNNAYTDANLDLLGRYGQNGGMIPNGTAYDAPAHSCGATNGTAIVGSYAPNDWGLYDVHGNVWEWCLDWYADDITAHGGKVNIDPATPENTRSGAPGGYRVIRGGSYNYGASLSRPAYRNSANPIHRYSVYGFRLLCYAGLR